MPDPSITDLRRAAALLAGMSDPAAARVAAALRRYEAEASFGVTLEQAAGLARAPGKTPWWEAEAIERRDTALRAMRDQHCAHLTITQAARQLATMGRRYQAGAGRRDRLAHPSKTLFDVVVQAGGFPRERRILDILRSK